MLIWILAFVLFGALGVVGFYQGALRVVFSFIGIIVAALVAVPFSPPVKWVLGLFSVEHPVLLAFLCPVITYLVVLVCFKAGGMAVHKKVDTWFKYKASDTVRLMYDRMNARVGVAAGLFNAFVYLILLSVVIYMSGYFFQQVRVSDKDTFIGKRLAELAEDLRATGMDRAVAAFIPKAELYFDGADVVADVFLNPLLQNRLSTYPPFLLLAEKGEYKQLAQNAQFQDFWQKTPSFQEFRSHVSILPMVESAEWYNKMVATLDGDFKDLKTYLETGKSPKYDDEAIYGRWDYDGAKSFAEARRRRPNMSRQDILRLRQALGAFFKDAQIVAAVKNKVILKLPRMPNARSEQNGTWEQAKGGGYQLLFEEGEKAVKVDALVDGRKMTVTFQGYALIFEK